MGAPWVLDLPCKSGLLLQARQPGKWPSCPCGRLGKSGPGPPSGTGPPHASSNAVGWPEMAHREGVPSMGPPNRDFLAFLHESGRDSQAFRAKAACLPALPASVGEARQPGTWSFLPVWPARKKGPPHASSNAVRVARNGSS